MSATDKSADAAANSFAATLSRLSDAATQGEWSVMVDGPFRGRKVPTIYQAGSELRFIAYCADSVNIEATPNLTNAAFIIYLANRRREILALVSEAERVCVKLALDDDHPLRIALAALDRNGDGK